MPTAVAAQTVMPAGPIAPMETDAASITSIDFAALLLGQFSTDAGIAVPVTANLVAATSDTDTEAATPEDPALLLAAIGYAASLPGNPPTSAAPANATNPTSLTSSTGTRASLAGEGDNAILLPALPTNGTKKPASSVAPDQAELTSMHESVDMEVAQPQPTATSAPAKLAGFEQKLAEASAGKAEPTQAPQVLSGTLSNSGPASARNASENVHVDVPLKDAAWPAEFGQKVVWLATHDKQSAQITLNPPQLGPIEISLHVKSDQATAVFSSANADVREAIETALPRLREMLAGVGVELGQANVSAESFRQPADGGNHHRNGGQNRGAAEGSAHIGDTESIRGGSMIGGGRTRGIGLVDTFA